MITHYQKQSTSIEISRPVTNGVREFLDQARMYGNEIFGDDVSAIIDSGDEERPGYRKLVGVGSPLLSLYHLADIRLIMFEKRAPAAMNISGTFRHALFRLGSDADPYYEFVSECNDLGEKNDTSLEATLQRVGLKHDIPEQTDFVLPCDNIALRSDGIFDGRNGGELSLVPAAESHVTAMLVEQAGLCVRALAYHGRKSVNPMNPDIINVPIGRLPKDVSDAERQQFISRTKRLLPVYLTLGYVNTEFTRQHNGAGEE